MSNDKIKTVGVMPVTRVMKG